MITVSFLLCATSSFNYCCLAFYMIYITMNWLSYVCTVGLIIQDGGFRNVFTSGYTSVVFQLVLTCMFIVYYTIAFFICFYAYKEFKGMLFDVTESGGMMGM